MSSNSDNARRGRHAQPGSYANQQAARAAYDQAASAYNAANSSVPNAASGSHQDYAYYADYAYGHPYAQGARTQAFAAAPARAAWAGSAPVVQARKRRVPRFLKFLFGLLLAVVLAMAGYVLYLNNVMSLGDRLDSVREALTPSLPGQPFYMLVVGTDSRDASGDSVGLTDVMMLVRIDASTKTVTSISIPRDTPWRDSAGEIHKINAAYQLAGPQGCIDAVEELAGVGVSHFAEVNFGGFGDLVDALGGIDVEVPLTVGYKDAYTGEYVEVPEGYQHLNGQEATILCRARNEYGDHPEVSRQSTVRLVTKSLLSSLAHVPLYRLPSTVTTAARSVDTDMGILEMLALAPRMRGGMTYYSATGPHEGDINPYCNDQYFCYLDPVGWSNLMQVVDAGEDPSTVSFDGDPVSVVGAP